MRRLILLVVMIVACGPAQAQPPASPTPVIATPSPSPAVGSLVFAALQADGSANPEQWNAIAIVRPDGSVAAKTAFLPMPVPSAGCLAAILPQSAHVAMGKVFYADGTGVVRSLSGDGRITPVATFPFTGNQQMLSFAVSPDGTRLLGAVFTMPSKPNLACSGTAVTTGYGLDVYSAVAGGPTTLLYRQKLPNSDVMKLIGWDLVGPLGTYPTEWASQGGGPVPNFRGNPVRIDPDTGKVLRQVSDPSSCLVWDIGISGDYTCVPAGTANVAIRQPDGHEIWRVGPSSNGYYFLSPDEMRVLTGVDVLGRDATRTKLPSGFFPEGWLDSAIVIGTPIGNAGRGNLTLVRLSAPDTVVDLGLKGLFIGTVRS